MGIQTYLKLVVLRSYEINNALNKLGGGGRVGGQGGVQVHTRAADLLLENHIQLLPHCLQQSTTRWAMIDVPNTYNHAHCKYVTLATRLHYSAQFLPISLQCRCKAQYIPYTKCIPALLTLIVCATSCKAVTNFT